MWYHLPFSNSSKFTRLLRSPTCFLYRLYTKLGSHKEYYVLLTILTKSNRQQKCVNAHVLANKGSEFEKTASILGRKCSWCSGNMPASIRMYILFDRVAKTAAVAVTTMVQKGSTHLHTFSCWVCWSWQKSPLQLTMASTSSTVHVIHQKLTVYKFCGFDSKTTAVGVQQNI